MAESARRRRLRAPSFGVGEVIGDTFTIWFRNLIPFFVLTVIVHAPLIIYAAAILYGDPTASEVRTFGIVQQWGGMLLNLVVTGAVSYGVFRQLSGNPAGLADGIVMGLRRLLPVLGVAICQVLLIVGCLLPLIFLAMVGMPTAISIFLGMFVLLVVIVVWCMLFVAVPAAVVESPGVVASLKRSAALTQGAKWGIFGIAFVIFLFIGLVGVFVGLVLEAGQAQVWIMMGLQYALGLLMPVAQASAYYRLRVAKEGIGVDELVRVFA